MFMVESSLCGHSSVGRASAFQAERRGSKSRCPLQNGHICPFFDGSKDERDRTYIHLSWNYSLHLSWNKNFGDESQIRSFRLPTFCNYFRRFNNFGQLFIFDDMDHLNDHFSSARFCYGAMNFAVREKV
jgi:hypothetical protein